MPELSVIIPTRKPEWDVEALHHLDPDCETEFEVILRDDPGVTTARNEGIRRAEADKLVFLDDDSRPTDGYLDRVAAALDREAVVAGRTVHPRRDVFDRLAGHYDFGTEGCYVTRFWGCNAAFRREVFDAVGPWDERILWGHEEKELADRVLRHCPIYYDPELIVYHPYADSIPGYWYKMYRLETQTPYYWSTRGVPERQQWIRIMKAALDPTKYLGVSPTHTAARCGGQLAVTLGRLRGMWNERRG